MTAQQKADVYNDHLKTGGVVQVMTHLKSWLFDSRHVGYFTAGKDDHIYIPQGKRKVSLGRFDRPVVSIRLGRFVEKN